MAQTIMRTFQKIPTLERVALGFFGVDRTVERAFFGRAMLCGGERMNKLLKHSFRTAEEFIRVGGFDEIDRAGCQVFERRKRNQ